MADRSRASLAAAASPGREARPGALTPIGALLGSRLRSQLQYRTSFTADVAGSLAIGVLEIVELLVILGAATTLAGLPFEVCLLIYGVSGAGFAIADLLVGHVDRLPDYVRRGTLDALLLRPVPVLAQLVTIDVEFHRIGRLLPAVLAIVWALLLGGVPFGAAQLAFLLASVVAAAGIFGALFVTAAGAQFWLLDGREFMNAFTYGGNYAASYPASLYAQPLRFAFTFVVPAAFAGYLPVLSLLGLTEGTGLPAWIGWLAPAATVLAWLAALAVWRAGLRHYTSAGS